MVWPLIRAAAESVADTCIFPLQDVLERRAGLVALMAVPERELRLGDDARQRRAQLVRDLGGQTLVPGVYTGGALALNGTLTLNAQGNPSAVFVFQGASTLITGSTSRVALIGGATACNVFWEVGSSATLGTTGSVSTLM